jgi:hypothetical protein
MTRLIVAGNGFDLAHGIPSSYFAFRDHLIETNESLYQILTSLGGEDIWCDFENNLAHIDLMSLTTNLIESTGLADRSIERFRAQTRVTFEGHSVASGLREVSQKISDELHEELKSWILSIDIAHDKAPKLAKFLPDDYFVSFNYTSTVEDGYEIDSGKILYVHNKASDNRLGFYYEPIHNYQLRHQHNAGHRIIFGHGFIGHHPECTTHLPTDSDGGRNPDEERIHEAYADACSVYSNTYKNTEEHIANLKQFLGGIGEISEVAILGHSLSHVDINYFTEIAARVGQYAKYKITYFGEENMATIKERAAVFAKSEQYIEYIDASRQNHLIHLNPP